jgi:hypothetical protein
LGALGNIDPLTQLSAKLERELAAAKERLFRYQEEFEAAIARAEKAEAERDGLVGSSDSGATKPRTLDGLVGSSESKGE